MHIPNTNPLWAREGRLMMYLPSVHCGNPPYHRPKKSTLKYSGQVTAFVIIKIYMKFQPISMGKKWFYDHMCFFF